MESLPGYDAWKLASPPERAFPKGVEDILGTLYYCLDEDGELCLFAYADDFYEYCEYDCEGFAIGGYEVCIELKCYTPDGKRAKRWDHSERLSDLEDGGTNHEWRIPSRFLASTFARIRAEVETRDKV